MKVKEKNNKYHNFGHVLHAINLKSYSVLICPLSLGIIRIIDAWLVIIAYENIASPCAILILISNTFRRNEIFCI